MSIKYYCSGFDEEKGFPQELIAYLKVDIKNFKKIVFIPTDFTKKEKIEKNSKGLVETFRKGNFIFNDVIILNENMLKEEMHKHIVSASVVFLMGGNPSTQLDIINSFDLENAIKISSAVVMGMSAGAMCMSDFSMLLPISEKYPNMDIRKGMNLSGINIYPHYNSNGEVPDILTVNDDKTKKEDLLCAINNYGPVYLLSDNSEIREENGILTFIGNNIIYASTEKIELVQHPNIMKK